jgi:DnaJ-class molecular chaperone
MENHYKTLGVSPSISAEDLHRAYKALAIRYHPDKNGGAIHAGKFTEITAAWGVLKDAKARREYDAQLKLLRKACADCNGTGVRTRASGFTSIVEVKCIPCNGEGYL